MAFCPKIYLKDVNDVAVLRNQVDDDSSFIVVMLSMVPRNIFTKAGIFQLEFPLL